MTVTLILLLGAAAVHLVCVIAMIVLHREPEQQERWRRTWRNSMIVAMWAAAVLIITTVIELFAPRALDFLIGWI